MAKQETRFQILSDCSNYSSIIFLTEVSPPEKSHKSYYVYHKLFTSLIMKHIFPTMVTSKHNKDMPLDDLIIRTNYYRSNSAVKVQVYNLYLSGKQILNTPLPAYEEPYLYHFYFSIPYPKAKHSQFAECSAEHTN